MAEVRKERALRGMMFSATFVAGSLVGLILFFLLYFSLPILTSGMLRDFLTKGWDPDARLLGVYPMIVGTVYIAGLATLWATPVGISLAVFMEFVAPNGIKKLIRAFVEFMAGIPTVVYGFAALFLLVPAVRGIFKYGSGLCVLSASLMLALLILPTITLIVQDRLTTVPKSYVLAAKSLGASDIETFLYVHLPYTWRGIISAVILGAGRACGDTMIALMLAGNALQVPRSFLDSARTLTSHIALITAADYESMSFKAIFVCGLILFVFSAWNIVFLRLIERLKR